MVRKPGRMYRTISGPSYTRREYMGGIPGLRISQFDMGNHKGSFGYNVNLIAKENCQIRHVAIEAARIIANKHLAKSVGTMNYHLKIRIYPHHVLRENKQATGAGADRVSDGMRRAFGKPVGTAARVKKEQVIMTIRINEERVEEAKKALKKAYMKLPVPCKIVVEKAA